jgi:FkbM family methyltransferase
MSTKQDNLIFDLGLNDGSDTDFYLRKGFRVVAVEANPLLYAAALEKFADAIADNSLTLLNIGVWSSREPMDFYINKANDHWSSFTREYGCRDGTPFEVIRVDCATISDLLREYGTPRYMKIDVEGADRIILEQLRSEPAKPEFISVEEYGVAAIDDLRQLGYSLFYFSPQRDKSQAIPPLPPREGAYVAKRFSGVDSGLFGEEIPGPWLPYDEAVEEFTRSIRRRDHTWVGPQHEWYDVHAR